MKRQFVLLVSICLATNVAATTIYKWIDKNNIAHYSQQPPENTEFTVIIMKADRQPATTSSQLDNSIEDESSLLADQFEQDAKAKCENAKSNMAKLKQYAKIEVTDETGQTRLLSETEKSQQLKLSEKQQAIYCQ